MRILGHQRFAFETGWFLSAFGSTLHAVCLTGALCAFLCALMFAQPSHAESRLTLESVLRDRGIELPSPQLRDLLEELDLQAEVTNIKIGNRDTRWPQGYVEICFKHGLGFVRYRLDNDELVGYIGGIETSTNTTFLSDEKVRERCNELFSALGRNRCISDNDLINYNKQNSRIIEVYLREILHDTYRLEGSIKLDSTGKIFACFFYTQLPPEEYRPLISEQEAIDIAHTFFARQGYKVLSATSNKIFWKPRFPVTLEEKQTMRDRYYWMIMCKMRFGWGILPAWLVNERDTYIFIDRETGEVH